MASSSSRPLEFGELRSLVAPAEGGTIGRAAPRLYSARLREAVAQR